MDRLVAMATFVRVVDAGSLSAAARSLPNSLTSVSRQISALEQHFGMPLLLRTTRHLALTDDGRILYERARAILGEVGELEAMLSRGRQAPAGRLRISAPTLMGRLLIAPLLADFLRRYPSLTVDLLLIDRAVDMVEEDIHLSLRVGHLAGFATGRAQARRLADGPLRGAGLSAAPRHPAAAFRATAPRLPGIFGYAGACRMALQGRRETGAQNPHIGSALGE